MQNTRTHKELQLSSVESSGAPPLHSNFADVRVLTTRKEDATQLITTKTRSSKHGRHVLVRMCYFKSVIIFLFYTMGYIFNTSPIICILAINIFQVFSITTRLDHPPRTFRRHIDGPPFPDWELGLREAAYQALLRERNLQPNLREFLYNAPLLGRQDSATPFGDIAILARGQLYSAPGGFQFVQDPYQNDCDGCHNPPPGCDRVPCNKWKPEAHERLLALWTVKRIRHRDPAYGYRYELEYKVSPMNLASRELFITRNGNFDYGIPGHTFIVKADPRRFDRHLNHYYVEKYQIPNSYDSDQWSSKFGPNLDGHHYLPPLPPPLIDDPYYQTRPREPSRFDKNKLYLPPKLESPEQVRPSHSSIVNENSEDERELYRKLLETLSQRTSTARQLSTTETSIFDESKSTTLATSLLSSQTTSPHLVTPQKIPILPTLPVYTTLRNTSPDFAIAKPLFTPTTIKFPTTTTIRSKTSVFKAYTTVTTGFSQSTPFVKYSEPDPLYSNAVPPSSSTKSQATTSKYKPIKEEDDDFDIFGPIAPKPIMEPNLSPLDRAITVVNAPNMVTEKHEEVVNVSTTETTSSSEKSVNKVDEDRLLPQESSSKPTTSKQSLQTDIKIERLPPTASTPIGTTLINRAPPTLSTEYFTQSQSTRFNVPTYHTTLTEIPSTPAAASKTTATIIPTTSKTTTIIIPTTSKTTTIIIPTTSKVITSITPSAKKSATKRFTTPKTSLPKTRRTKVRPTLPPRRALTSTATTQTTPTPSTTTTLITTTPLPPGTTINSPEEIHEEVTTPPPETTTKIEPPQTTTQKLEVTKTDFTLPTIQLKLSTRITSPTAPITTTEVPKQTTGTPFNTSETLKTQTSHPWTSTTTTQTSMQKKQTTSNFLKGSTTQQSTSHYKVTESEEDIDDDIFGKPAETSSVKPTSKKPTYQASKEVDEIFGSEFAKDLHKEESGERNVPKIIFSGFYAPSTLPTITEEAATAQTTVQASQEGFMNETDSPEPFTSQSEIIKISKEESNVTEADFSNGSVMFDPTVKADVKELPNVQDYKVYKAEFPEIVSKDETTGSSKGKRNDNGEGVGSNNVFDALALSVVNHAKSIDYLNNHENCSESYKDNKRIRERKYRRRGGYRPTKTRRRNEQEKT